MTQDFIRQLGSSSELNSQTLWSRLHIDPILFFLLLLLCCAGLFVLYSASGHNMDMLMRQAAYLAVGFAVMIVIAQMPPHFFIQWSFFIYLFGVVLLIMVFFVGTGAKGAQRWIGLSWVRFQPSEILKLIMPLVVAGYLSKHSVPPGYRQIAVTLLVVMIPVILVAKQPDLGTSLLIAASGIFVLLLAGLQWRLIFGALIMVVPLAWGMWHFIMHEYQKKRVLTFLNPESDPWGSGWNIIQAKIAIGSGGLTGKGWLSGTQSHLDFLPESHTDFILAVLAEEFGLIGVLALFMLYALIIGRVFYITTQASTLFGRLLSGALALTFFIYILVNVGMVSGLMPVVGVPLPLISRGGTSVIVLLSSFGLVMSVYTHKILLGR